MPAALPVITSIAGRRSVQVAAVTIALLVLMYGVLTILIVVPAPTLGGGDYGQWLMVARPYRGLDVPAYRNIGALPPLVPSAIAGLWAVLGDPVAALDVLDGALLLGLVAGFAAAAYALFRHPVAALVGPVVGLLVFDRFVELFAFGGILQLAADATSLLALALLVAAETRRSAGWLVRSISVLLLDLAALSHVGTTEAVAPVYLALTVVLGLAAARRVGLRAVFGYVAPLVLLLPVAAYWVAELLPANDTYFTNPATAAYRDPGSFIAALFAYLPDAIVLIAGMLALAAGVVTEARARRLGPWMLLGIWTAVAWAELGALVVVGTSTDFPRFATVLTPPLLLAVAGAVAVLIRRVVAIRGTQTWPLVVAGGLLAVGSLVPSAAGRDAGLARYYGSPSPAALDAAVRALDANLGTRAGTILTTVRGGKWLEGTTGRPSLFSQPTRFAVRPDEWQRSVDADVLTNAAAAIASPSFLVEYQHTLTGRGHSSVGDLVISGNHDGEWVDLIASIVRDTFVVDAMGTKHGGASFVPAADAEQAASNGTASIATSWVDASGFSMNRTVSVSDTAGTARLVETAAGAITTRLYPADGITFTSIEPKGNTARVCFSIQGRRSPCVDLALADPSGSITPIGDGGLWVRGGASGSLDLTITNLTAGTPIVGLESLTPAAVAQSNAIAGAILETSARGYADAADRMVALGLDLIGVYDRYAVFVRPPG